MSRLMYRMIRDAGVNRAYSRCHTPGGSRNTWRLMIQEHLETLGDTWSTCGKGQTAVLLLLHRTTFFARFDDSNSTPVMKINPPADDQVLKAAEVNTTLQRVNPRKAADPNGIPA